MLRRLFRIVFSKQRKQTHFELSGEAFEKYVRIRDEGISLLKSETDVRNFSSLESRIRSKFALTFYRRYSHKTGLLQVAAEERIAMQQVSGLASVFMFHGDGRIREEAIHNLHEPMLAPANVYALYWRLNDWAPEVRQASLAAVNRVMPPTEASIIVPALWAILPYAYTWGRWSEEGAKEIDKILTRPDVATVFLDEIKSTRRSHLGLIFRQLSKTPWIDLHVESVFRDAPLPHIRAIALDMLLTCSARWPTGQKRRVWTNRSVGEFRTEPVFAKREITIEVDAIELIAAGAMDRSAMVRRRAVDGLIALRHNPDIIAAMPQIVTHLREDPNIGVRTRIEFLLRKEVL